MIGAVPHTGDVEGGLAESQSIGVEQQLAAAAAASAWPSPIGGVLAALGVALEILPGPVGHCRRRPTLLDPATHLGRQFRLEASSGCKHTTGITVLSIEMAPNGGRNFTGIGEDLLPIGGAHPCVVVGSVGVEMGRRQRQSRCDWRTGQRQPLPPALASSGLCA